MARYTSSVSPKGQVTIPVEIREQFGIRPKDIVVFKVIDGTITMIPSLARLMEGYRSIPPLDPPRCWKEIEQIAHEEHALHVFAEDRESYTPDAD